LNNVATYIKIALATILLLCILDWGSYGYYLFLRYACVFGFGTLIFIDSKANNLWKILWVGCVVLWQPFWQIEFGEAGKWIWNVIDVFVAFCCLISLRGNKID